MALNLNAAVTIRAKVDGLANIEALNKTLGRSGNESKNAQSAFDRLNRSLNGLSGAITSIGLGRFVQSLGEAGLEGQRVERRIANLAGPLGETQRLMSLAGNAANQFGLSNTAAQTALADLYGRLRPTGVALKDIETVFTGVNKAAAAMNLTAADTDGVMLQLSQALGSGKLQGDELRSVMERLPAVGQAVAKVMGVTVGEIKQLGADGKITTDVIIKAMEELSKMQAPPPDPFKLFDAQMANLRRELGENLLPILTSLIQGLTQFATAFGALPEPVQTLIVGATALAAAIGAIASVITLIGPGLAAMGAALASLGPIMSGLLPILAAVFTGPVGWVALLVAAGVAIYAFRDKIADVFKGIGYVLQAAAQGFKSIFIDPITRNLSSMAQGIGQLFQTLGGILSRPFEAAAGAIRGIVNGIIGGVQNAINGAIGGINQLIAAANRALAVLQLPQIPFFPGVSLPRFADGGVVNGPTMALVGEGGEPEYIVPQSKAAGFAANWMAGRRGASAIPRFAEGGVVMPTSANVSIQTGPVTQMNGTNYVTTQDMSRAVQAGVNQTLAMLRNDMGTRRAVGLA